MSLSDGSRSGSDRRSFLTMLGASGLTLAGGAVLAERMVSDKSNVEAASYSYTDVLNFALNLEYLEAEFYAVSTYGATLVELGVLKQSQTTGPTTGGKMIKNFGALPEASIATALRMDEISHVKLLRAALGSAAAPKPAINLNALGYGYANISEWLKLARQFEDVGISAYLGAAPSLAGNATYLSTAAAIMATEAQHSGTLRWACIMNAVNSPAVDKMDIPPTPKMPFDDNANGLSIPRTPAQVLNIVYHGGKCSGGFYPNGMNGGITCQG